MRAAEAAGALLVTLEGFELGDGSRELLGTPEVAGVTLFQQANVRDAGQVRDLAAAVQAARAPGAPPLLVATDQEGGQLSALGAFLTPFPGTMALGATADEDLAERVARATGRELRAVGVNLNYGPVADLASNPGNPSVGARSFGEDVPTVSRFVAATVRGLQAEGVAATLKHFPGAGEAVVDPHRELPRLDPDPERLDEVELAPFRAGVDAGARAVMVGHHDVPALTGEPGLPTSLSRRAMGEGLRGRLGFDGVVVTDALDMGALSFAVDRTPAAALVAGADLLLCAGRIDPSRVRRAVLAAARDGSLAAADVDGSARRVGGLRRWVDGWNDPDIGVVGCREHVALARTVAERAVTLVRDDAGLLPLRLDSEASVAAVMPRPGDLTPADTSSNIEPALAEALRRHHPRVEEIVTAHPPTDGEIAALRSHVARHDLVVVGTLDAFRDPKQAALVAALADGPPLVTAALRGPYDLAVTPQVRTHACTYGVMPLSLQALAAALWGAAPFPGRLPASIPGLYPVGHGMSP